MRLAGHFTGAAHIFFKGQHAAVVHNGGKAQADGFFHQLRREAVVKVQRNGHTGAAGHAQHHVGIFRKRSAGQKAFGGPDDDGGVQFLRCRKDAFRHFQCDAVEQPNGIVLFTGVRENGFQID